MLAIPILHTRVAPVLDWCSRIQIFPQEQAGEEEGQEFFLPHLDPAARLKFLKDKGVTVLICGALSADLLHCARQLGITIVWGVAGEVAEVCRCYRQNQLNQPRFWLPGCRGLRWHRSGVLARNQGRCRRSGVGVPERITNVKANAHALCICPICQVTVPRERGLPCHRLRCPNCGHALSRGGQENRDDS